MTLPQVSVIIPVFNASATIARAIESVLRQSFVVRELIVIDGASTDGSIDIITSYKESITTFISEKDGGVYDAINKGITRAKGRWIYVLGADDRLANNFVLARIFAQAPGNEQLIFGSVINEGATNKLVPSTHRSSFDGTIRWKNTLHQQSVFYRADLFAEEKFNASLRILGDYDFHLRLYKKRTPYRETGEVIAICSAQGLSKNFEWPLYAEELRSKRKRLGIFAWMLNVPVVVGKFLAKKLG